MDVRIQIQTQWLWLWWKKRWFRKRWGGRNRKQAQIRRRSVNIVSNTANYTFGKNVNVIKIVLLYIQLVEVKTVDKAKAMKETLVKDTTGIKFSCTALYACHPLVIYKLLTVLTPPPSPVSYMTGITFSWDYQNKHSSRSNNSIVAVSHNQ